MANSKKNRKWVIKAAIIFVAALALLTFFSNTIMNATIPRVVTANSRRGNLAYTNSASGVVAAEGVTTIKGLDGRIVDQVLLTDYDRVSVGDVIMTLKPAENTEALDTLEDQLEQLQRDAEYANRQPTTTTDYSAYQQAIVDAQEALTQARSTLSAAQNRDATISSAQAVIDTNSATAISLEAEVASASDTVENINSQIAANNIEINNLNSSINVLVTLGTPTPTPAPTGVVTPVPTPGSMEDLIAQRDALVAQNSTLEASLTEAQSRLSNAASQLATVNANIDSAQATLESAQGLPSVASAQSAVNTAQAAVTAAQEAYTNIQITDGISSDQAQDAVEDRNEQIEELEEQIEQARAIYETTEIVATAEGYIYGQTVTAGSILSKDEVVLTIIPNDVECTVTFTFDSTAAQNFSVGMELSIDSYWIESCTIISIKPDAADPRNSRTVKCSIIGDVVPGEQITAVADRSNSDYDCVIASSAINEDNSGTFVYVLEESSTVLGDKYVVHRVNVTVEATDGANSAISGDNLEGAIIVVRSEEPLQDGDRVRLADYSSSNSDERS